MNLPSYDPDHGKTRKDIIKERDEAIEALRLLLQEVTVDTQVLAYVDIRIFEKAQAALANCGKEGL